MRATLAHLVEHHPVLRELDESFIQRAGVHRALCADDILYTSGEEADALFFVLKGALQIEYPELGGARGRAVAIVVSPGVLGECQTLYRRPWTGTGVALGDLDVYAMDRKAARTVLADYPRATELLYCELAWQFLGAIDRRRVELAREPKEKLAHYLCDLDRVFAELHKDYSGWLPVTQGDLGRACDLRRETVARVFAAWKKDGGIKTGRGRIQISDSIRPTGDYPSLLSRMHEPLE